MVVAPALARNRHWAVAGTFALNGAVYGSWASRIPAIKDELDLPESQLGLALFAYAIGAVATMPGSGAAVRRVGGRVVCRLAGPAFAAADLRADLR